jgi:hypothetical protein
MFPIKMALLFSLTLGFAFSDALVVRLLAGDVKVRRGGDLVALKLGDNVRENEQVITGPSSFAALRSEDGSVFKLAADTIFDVKTLENTPASRKHQFAIPQGKVFSSIARLTKQSDVSFSTPSAVAGVRGTILILDVTPSGTRLFVLKGRVAFGHAGNLNKMVGANQKGDANASGAPVEVKAMTPADQAQAILGIPVTMTLQVNPTLVAAATGAAELKNELRQNTVAQQQRATQSLQREQQRVEWDAENGRTVRVGGDLFQVSEKFRRLDDKSIRLLHVMDNTTQKRVTVFEAKSFWEKGIPSVSTILAGTGDVSSALPTRSDITMSVKEALKPGDLVEMSLVKSGSSFVQSYRVNRGEWYVGDRVAQVTENGKSYLVLKNGTGASDYRFEFQSRVVNGNTGADTTLSVSGIDPAKIVGFLQNLGDTAVYVAWIPDTTGGSGIFNSGKIEVIVTAEHVSKMLVLLLTQL